MDSAPATLPRLLTFPVSHYCEKARWALEHCGVSYREEPHLPLVHLRMTRRLGGRSVPLLATSDGVLRDSHAICEWADARSGAHALYPEDPAAARQVRELEAFLDRALGPPVRQWAYGYLLDEPALLRPCFTRGLPGVERMVAPVVLAFVRPMIRRGYGVRREGSAHARSRIDGALATVARRLEAGHRYLVGEAFTAADLTLAALAAPLACPPQYGGALPALAQLPAAMRADIESFRATRAGAAVLDCYARHR